MPLAKKASKIRIDQLLVLQGLVPSRERAQALILAGKVLVNENRVEKPSELYPPQNSHIRLKVPDHPYVSRGGVKIAGAVQSFNVSIKEKVCLDVGASTGGFTDFLLQNGAKKVYTLDCGTHQLHDRLRSDPRVQCRENFNIRFLKPSDIPENIDLIVIDVSFISLKLVIPPLVTSLPGPWELLALVKPQFEAGRDKIKKGGLIKDPKLENQIVHEIEEMITSHGLELLGNCPATIKGEKGNQEYFIYAKNLLINSLE